MMIDPTTFVDIELRGKSRDAAVKQVKLLWKEIRRLKKVIEEEPDSVEMMICPGPDVQISVFRDYIVSAREYFESQEWEYVPAREEIKDKRFNERLQDIETIIIGDIGYLCEDAKRTISFDGEKILMDRECLKGIPSKDELKQNPLNCISEMKRSEFIKGLADLHLGEWKKEYYDLNVLGGTQLSVVIKFSSGKDFKCCCSNRFPYNFNSFLDLMGISKADI